MIANFVVEDCVERIFVGNKYTEKPLGSFIVRGENVILLGEMVHLFAFNTANSPLIQTQDENHEETVASKTLQLVPAVELMELKRVKDEKKKELDNVRRMMNLPPASNGFDED